MLRKLVSSLQHSGRGENLRAEECSAGSPSLHIQTTIHESLRMHVRCHRTSRAQQKCTAPVQQIGRKSKQKRKHQKLKLKPSEARKFELKLNSFCDVDAKQKTPNLRTKRRRKPKFGKLRHKNRQSDISEFDENETDKSHFAQFCEIVLNQQRIRWQQQQEQSEQRCKSIRFHTSFKSLSSKAICVKATQQNSSD